MQASPSYSFADMLCRSAHPTAQQTCYVGQPSPTAQQTCYVQVSPSYSLEDMLCVGQPIIQLRRHVMWASPSYSFEDMLCRSAHPKTQQTCYVAQPILQLSTHVMVVSPSYGLVGILCRTAHPTAQQACYVGQPIVQLSRHVTYVGQPIVQLSRHIMQVSQTLQLSRHVIQVSLADILCRSAQKTCYEGQYSRHVMNIAKTPSRNRKELITVGKDRVVFVVGSSAIVCKTLLPKFIMRFCNLTHKSKYKFLNAITLPVTFVWFGFSELWQQPAYSCSTQPGGLPAAERRTAD